MKILGIILAAGEGTRLKAQNTNKTVLDFAGRPMISFGVETMSKICDQTIVVVGAYADTVKKALSKYDLIYALQEQRKGTGDAALIALQAIKANYDLVLLGYGDHMMFYTPEIMHKLKDYHLQKQKSLTLLTTEHQNPDKLAWGRIVRDKQGEVVKIIEQKDASSAERKITELNPAFYCFDFDFFQKYLPTIQPSKITGEYYLTDMVELAFTKGAGVAALKVPFENVGIGVNTPEQLADSQRLFQNRK